VKIDLDTQLFRWRQRVVENGSVSLAKRVTIDGSTKVLDRPRLFRLFGGLVRLGLKILPVPLARRASGAWGRTREAPVPPAQSFRSWYRRHRRGSA
jgi:L-lactate dehydrogenase complex protein LldF